MTSQIRPMREVEESAVVEFFERQGIPGSVTRWKYYDETFNQGRNRGFVALKNGGVTGFIGVIPFLIVAGMDKRLAVWTCDWYTDRTRPEHGLGLRLLRTVMDSQNLVLHAMGNEISRQILDRIAPRTLRETALLLRASLRLEDALAFLDRRLRVRIPWGPIRRCRVWFQTVTLPESAHIDMGVPSSIEHVLEEHSPSLCYPKYDHAYIEWMVGRCPELYSFTCLAGDPEAPRAAALFWRSDRSANVWRMAVWPGRLTTRQLAGMLSEGVRHVDGLGGVAVSAIVSINDKSALAALKMLGFYRRAWVPLDVLRSANADFPVHELAGLSYLDDDLAVAYSREDGS